MLSSIINWLYKVITIKIVGVFLSKISCWVIDLAVKEYQYILNSSDFYECRGVTKTNTRMYLIHILMVSLMMPPAQNYCYVLLCDVEGQLHVSKIKELNSSILSCQRDLFLDYSFKKHFT